MWHWNLRKIPQSGDMSHRGFIRIVQTFELFGHLRIGKLEVLVFSLPCLVSVTLDLRKIPHSGDMSHRGFIRIVWTFQNWKVRGYVLSCFWKNLTERGYITSGVIVFLRTGCRFSSWDSWLGWLLQVYFYKLTHVCWPLTERCGRVQIFCGNKFEKFIENLFLFWVWK